MPFIESGRFAYRKQQRMDDVNVDDVKSIGQTRAKLLE